MILLRLESSSNQDENVTAAFVTLDEQCRFNVAGHEKHPLIIQEDLKANAGHTTQPKVKDLLCDTAIPFLILLQSFLFESYPVMLLLIYMASLCILTVGWGLGLIWEGARLLPTTFLLRSFLKWPQNFVGNRKVTFWSVWSNLLVLSKVNAHFCSFNEGAFWSSVALCVGMMAVLTFVYEDKDAARGWIQLAIVWHGFPFLVPLLDTAQLWIRQFDMFDLIGWGSAMVNNLVPGSGWEKYVFLWVFWQTYPCRNQKGRVLGWLGLNSKEKDNHFASDDKGFDSDGYGVDEKKSA